ncbi:hypothetical protein [Buttiauxella massiliensis]
MVISTLSVTPQRAEVIDFTRAYAGLRAVIAAQDSMLSKDANRSALR